MDPDQYEKMWELMRQFNLHFVDEIAPLYKCCICKNIIINAAVTPCECRFCFRCVNQYLEDGPKTCPGPSELCKDELLDLSQNNRNVIINRGMNSKISKFQINCPNGACQSIMELNQLADHLITCDYKPQICPFAIIGCRQDQMTRDQISHHISINNMDHVQLMIDYICQSYNELNELKRQLINSKSENELEKEKMRLENKELMDKFQEKIDEMNETMRQDRQNAQNTIQLLVDETNANKAEITKLLKIVEPSIIGPSIVNSSIVEPSIVNSSIVEPSIVNSSIVKPSIVEPWIVNKKSGEIIWTIKNWADLLAKRTTMKDDEDIWINESDPFESHYQGYQMSLIGKISTRSLFLYLRIYNGSNDDILHWPFDRKVQISIIDQVTGHDFETWFHNCSKYPKAPGLQKPTKEISNILYYIQLCISLSIISANPNATINNQLIIKFSSKPANIR